MITVSGSFGSAADETIPESDINFFNYFISCACDSSVRFFCTVDIMARYQLLNNNWLT